MIEGTRPRCWWLLAMSLCERRAIAHPRAWSLAWEPAIRVVPNGSTGIAAAGSAGVVRGLLICVVIAIAGCYQPAVSDCTVTCEAATDCVDGQTCRDGFCASDHATCGASTVLDARSTADAMRDADLCPQGCTNGTCVDGVCVIDCTADGSCQDDFTCPPNIPCRVECGGRYSCDHKIFCGLASACTVVCSGAFACKDEIVCNANRCDVTCSGEDSCLKRVKCASSCACDVRCPGIDSCGETNDCPDATCRLGEGCSSQLAGCNTCS